MSQKLNPKKFFAYLQKQLGWNDKQMHAFQTRCQQEGLVQDGYIDGDGAIELLNQIKEEKTDDTDTMDAA